MSSLFKPPRLEGLPQQPEDPAERTQPSDTAQKLLLSWEELIAATGRRSEGESGYSTSTGAPFPRQQPSLLAEPKFPAAPSDAAVTPTQDPTSAQPLAAEEAHKVAAQTLARSAHRQPAPPPVRIPVPTNLSELVLKSPLDRVKEPDHYAPPYWATEYHPTLRDWIASQFMGDKVRSSEYERSVRNLIGSTGLGNTGPSMFDFVPAVGTAIGAQEAAQEGDGPGLVLSAVPFGGPLLRGALKRATRLGVVRNNPRAWKALRTYGTVPGMEIS